MTFDETNGYPATPDDKKVSWENFISDIHSNDFPYDDAWNIADANGEELIDLRPYMIENPLTVHAFIRLPKILTIFRLHHLRHLPVVAPSTREILGIITRKDIFAYMPL